MFRAKKIIKVAALLLPLLSMGVSIKVFAENESEVTHLDELRVTGMQEEELNQSIAPKRVGKEVLESSRATDVGRALRNVPGVYVRDEDGQGLRPNIGLRGTNPDRSKKVVIMEDEILSGPAPYSAPAAYYTPPLSLAEELEIFRGFSAMAYGPNSIGAPLTMSVIRFRKQRHAGWMWVTAVIIRSISKDLLAIGPHGAVIFFSFQEYRPTVSKNWIRTSSPVFIVMISKSRSNMICRK